MIWNLSLAGFLVWLGQKRNIKAPGIFALYVAGYSGFRIFEETMRIDYSNYVLGMRLNFWIALLLCLGGLLWFVAIQRGWRLPLLSGVRRSPSVSRKPERLAAPERADRDHVVMRRAPRGGHGPR